MYHIIPDVFLEICMSGGTAVAFSIDLEKLFSVVSCRTACCDACERWESSKAGCACLTWFQWEKKE